MNKKQMKSASETLSSWLADETAFGHKPYKIECVGEFYEFDMRYYLFAYTPEKGGERYVGICGGYKDESLEHCGHVFGARDVYDKKTALELGRKMAHFISEIYSAQAKMQDIFGQNLKYLGNTEVSPDAIERQFVKSETRFFLTVGTVDIPSGRVVAADPLCYLAKGEFSPVLEREIPKGSYPAEVSIVRSDAVGIRMCTARLKIKPTKAVRYEQAYPTEETAAAKGRDGVWCGFPVDAGLMCFIDADGAKGFAEFISKWHKENPGKNHYDDYFEEFFRQSDEKLPAYQRDGGDFIEWEDPDKGGRMVMISSGFGDGFYKTFWGFDDAGEVCELIVPMVDPDIVEGLKRQA